ncbi:MAG: hypothetical protein ACJ72D_10980 [Marmoricola sp.]
MTARSRALSAAAVSAALALALTACGSSSGSKSREDSEPTVKTTPSAQVTATPAADAEVIAIKLTGDSVSPDGVRVKITKNQPVVLKIDAAKAGELHVHSSPEQHIDFPAGASEVTLSFKQAGVIDVEDHALDKLIVQLEVR